MSEVPSIGRPRTTAEAATFFNVDPRTIGRWRKAGLLSCVKAPGLRGAVRFRDEDIAECLDRLTAGVTPAAEARPLRNPKYA